MKRLSARSPSRPQQFFRSVTISFTLLSAGGRGGGGPPHALPNPLNGTVDPKYLDVATRTQDDSGGEYMNSGKIVLLGSYCLPSETRGSVLEGRRDRGSQVGSPVPLEKQWLSQSHGEHLGAMDSS